jgi:putative glutamine amidotransferase
MSAPLIGLTSFRHPNEQGHPLISINEAYVMAVASAGAAPLLIPLGLSEDSLDHILTRLDGIILTGGGDMQPDRYGSQPHPKLDGVDPDRDRVELYLARCGLAAKLPVLGICRGLQLINVALGGTLYEDILDQRPGALKHQYDPGWPRDYLAHPVSVEKDSRLAQILGTNEVQVNSLHHQGIRELTSSARSVAYAPDGLIEAIELRDYPYGLAVQWHPEWLPEHAAMRAIFADFVQAATQRES